jgi:hypothetical protein
MGELSWRTITHRLVYRPPGGELGALELDILTDGSFSLFESAAEPQEQVDVLGVQLPLAERLRGEMSAAYGKLKRSTKARPMTEEQREIMREGGYWN